MAPHTRKRESRNLAWDSLSPKEPRNGGASMHRGRLLLANRIL